MFKIELLRQLTVILFFNDCFSIKIFEMPILLKFRIEIEEHISCV